MNIKPISYAGIVPTKDDKDILTTLTTIGFSGPRKLPRVIKLFDKDVEYISIGQYGQVLVGGWHRELHTIPTHWEDFKGENILLALGQPISLFACGNSVKIFERNERIVIDFNVKDYDKKIRQMFQIHFPLKEPNIVEYHYYKVHTEYNVMIGALRKKDDYVEWTDVKENWSYNHVALRIDTSPSATAADVLEELEQERQRELNAERARQIKDLSKEPDIPLKDGYEWKIFSTPMGKLWHQVPKAKEEFVTVFENDTIKVMVKK